MSSWRGSVNKNDGKKSSTPHHRLIGQPDNDHWYSSLTNLPASKRNTYCVYLVLFLACAMLFVVAVVIANASTPGPLDISCASEKCQYTVVESIPFGLNQTLHTNMTIYQSYVDILNNAQHSVDIACFYMTFNAQGPEGTGSEYGRAVYSAIVAAAKRGVKIRIAVSNPVDPSVHQDTTELQKEKLAEVRTVDMPKFFSTHSGVLHTKFIVADGKAMYVGSANMDWRSLTQVKELGLYITDCACLSSDISKVFEMYWAAGEMSSLPEYWPRNMETARNEQSPHSVDLNGVKGTVFMSSAPKAMAPLGRTFDRDAIVHVMNNATEFIRIEVMDYSPTLLYSKPATYYPYLDDAIRWAAQRDVKVEMLIALWDHTQASQIMYLRSLNQIKNVEVKLFVVPKSEGEEVPFTRVNHAKYMVTDKVVFVGTSNWSGDYFVDTGGVGFVADHQPLRMDINNRFLRDWTSQYSHVMNQTWPDF